MESIQKRANRKDGTDLFSGWLFCMLLLSLFLCAPIISLSGGNGGVMLLMFFIAVGISSCLVLWAKSRKDDTFACSMYCSSYRSWLLEQRRQYMASLSEPLAKVFRKTSAYTEWSEEWGKQNRPLRLPSHDGSRPSIWNPAEKQTPQDMAFYDPNQEV
jgi:hypothetical protein